MDNVATPHSLIGDEVIPVPYDLTDNHAPAGAINSCVKDMAEWLRLQLAYGWYDGRQLVDSTVICETRKSHTLIEITEEGRKVNPWTHFVTYGLGWVLADYEGRLVVYHTGGLDGMYSYTGFLPEEKLGVVVLTNRDSHNLMRAIAFDIYDRYLGAEFRDWSRRYYDAYEERLARREEEKRKREEARIEGTKPSHPLAQYSGEYEDAVYGPADVRMEKGILVLYPKAHPGITGTMEHWQFDTFLCTSSSRIWDESLVYFDLDDEGNVAEFRVTVRPDWIDTREYRFVRK
jgi:hypothetical protein